MSTRSRSTALFSVAGAVVSLATLVGVGAPAHADWRDGPAGPPSAFAGADSQTVVVRAHRPDPAYTAPLAPGMIYVVEAWGTFSVWGDQHDGVDAYYAYSPRVGPQPQLWSQLLIDNRSMYEIARSHGDPVWFNPSHVYSTTIRGAGRPVALQILDARNGSWQDNHGELTVRISPRGGYAGPSAAPPGPQGPPPPPYPAPSSYAGSEGWRRPDDAFLRDEGLAVFADRPQPVWTRQPLAPGAWYTVEVSASFSFLRVPNAGADAFYAFADRVRGPRVELRPELLIDDQLASDLLASDRQPVPAYNPGHTYAFTIRGTGRPLKLQIVESRNARWRDASGALQVRIRRR